MRNRIYEYAIEDEQVALRNAAVLPLDLWTGAKNPSLLLNTPRYLGFTRSCSVVRKEFRPLYMARTSFRMSLAKAQSFIEVFLLPYNIKHANIIIDLSLGLPLVELDILPLMNYIREMPGIRIIIVHSGFIPTGNRVNYSKDIAGVLGIKGSLMCDEVCFATSRVTLRRHVSKMKVVFHINPYDTDYFAGSNSMIDPTSASEDRIEQYLGFHTLEGKWLQKMGVTELTNIEARVHLVNQGT